jgi:hypothetical protein
MFMPEVNEYDDDGLQVPELNDSRDHDESCKLWRLKNEHEHEQYVKERNTRDVLTAEAEAQVKFYVDAATTSQQRLAAVSADPIIRAGITQDHYTNTFSSELPNLVKELRRRCDRNNYQQTLAAQASTLDSIFNALATQAACVGWNSNIDLAETLLKLALKAQSQSARTLQALLMAQEIAKKAPNELIVNENGVNHGTEKMVEGTTCLAVESDTASPALACINGRKVL